MISSFEDAHLLGRYARGSSDADEAYTEFVRRHVDFVYGCALRRAAGDSHLAEDITQHVFVIAARQAGRLSEHHAITGWLFTTTRNVAVQRIRSERRRRHREEEAYAMEQNDGVQPIDWTRLRQVIDDALDHLSGNDREAVLLRFFDGLSYPDIAARLRVAENTARMRVDRALERLSTVLARRGIDSTAAALAAGLAAQVSTAAPTGLAASVTGAAIAAPTGLSLTFIGVSKLQAAVALAVTVASGTCLFVQQRRTAAVATELAVEQVAVHRLVSRLPTPTAQWSEVDRATEEKRRTATRVAEVAAQNSALRSELRKRTESSLSIGRDQLTFEPGPILDVTAVDRQPTFIAPPAPVYPQAMRQAGVPGEAVVEVVIGADGTVMSARAVDASAPPFAAAAVDAVRHWKSEPALKDGRPVATRVHVPFKFTVKDDGTILTGQSPAPWF
jgi:RNA polymerase sigma factor (sigma-70 family)